MNRDLILNEYFKWLCDLVRGNKQESYSKLLMTLHDTEFICTLSRDSSRAEDGVELRYRFAITQGYEESSRTVCDILDGPCSVLEMMVTMSLHCEEWMDDTSIGDRTSQWFWGMIVNLGLGSMYDSRFDRQLVEHVLSDFLHRNYEPDGKGGLFRIPNPKRDLRDVEIWIQMCWYLDDIM